MGFESVEKYWEVNIRSDVEQLDLNASGEVVVRPWTAHKIRIFALTPATAAEIGLSKFLDLAMKAKVCMESPRVTSIKDLGPVAAKDRREWLSLVERQEGESRHLDEIPRQYEDHFSKQDIWWC